jgi:hypothetical protein
MANVGNKGIVRYEETFSVPNIGTGVQGLDGGTNAANGIAWLQNIDTGDKAWARSMSASKGMHIAGSIAGTDNNMIEFCGDQLMFYGSTGFNAVEALIQFDVATNIAFNFGFSDDVTETSATLPVELSTATFYSSASTFLGFVFDTDATNDELHCFWTDDDVDTTETLDNLRMKGFSLTANKWLWLRVEMQDRGSGTGVRATFHAAQDGKHATKEFNTTVDNDCALCWYFAAENRSAIGHNVYIKLPAWEQSIAD